MKKLMVIEGDCLLNVGGSILEIQKKRGDRGTRNKMTLEQMKMHAI